MPPRLLLITISLALLNACGYKGDLYLPREDDKARFGAVQTGLYPSPVQPQNQAHHD